MSEATHKDGRGGKRKGAGRPNTVATDMKDDLGKDVKLKEKVIAYLTAIIDDEQEAVPYRLDACKTLMPYLFEKKPQSVKQISTKDVRKRIILERPDPVGRN